MAQISGWSFLSLLIAHVVVIVFLVGLTRNTAAVSGFPTDRSRFRRGGVAEHAITVRANQTHRELRVHDDCRYPTQCDRVWQWSIFTCRKSCCLTQSYGHKENGHEYPRTDVKTRSRGHIR